MWHVPLEEVAISATVQPPSRRPTNWRTFISKKFLHCCKVLGSTTYFSTWGSGKGLRTPREADPLRVQQNLMCTRTQETGAMTPKETEPDLPVSVQESLAEVWADSGLPQGQGH